MLRAARVPGAAVAVVAEGRTVYAKGFGYRELRAKKPVRPDTVFPIASTSKPMNATLLGMLVDEGRLEWDAPVQTYVPQFRLQDCHISSRVTVRDLLTMQTGLPRHDWVWTGNPQTRPDLVARLVHLDLSAGFRQRFQYCNLSATAAGHVAEVITGKSWETLVQQRIFIPLGMRRTSCAEPSHDNVTHSYHETARRKLIPSRRLYSESTAPSGGAVHSTVEDMARWILFNLNGGVAKRHRLLAPKTLAEIHTPQIIIGHRSLTGLPPEAAYALGWIVHPYNGHECISHAGYLHDVNSSVMFFPGKGIGIVSFINFGCPVLADLINQHVFDSIMGLTPVQTLEQKLVQYENQIEKTLKRLGSLSRVPDTRPSHPISSYAGTYEHPGYGEINIRCRGGTLVLRRGDLVLALEHWHYDAWVPVDHPMWAIHQQHAFDRSSRLLFHTNADGEIAALSIKLDSSVPPIQFQKRNLR